MPTYFWSGAERGYSLAVAFPEKLLNPDEEIVLDLRPHWTFFVTQLLLMLAALVLVVLAVVLDLNSIIQVILLAGFAVALLNLAWRLVKWQGINMVVTSERMVFRTGVVAKKGIEVPLERINTVFFNQSILERLVGSGDLSVESAGEGGRQDFDNVWRPNRVQQMIYQAKEANEDQQHQEAAQAIVDAQAAAVEAQIAPLAASVAASVNAGASIPEQIGQLDDLRVRGVITDAEFEAKKTQLLNRM